MRKEYDFKKGQKGKFYRPDMKLNIPVAVFNSCKSREKMLYF